VGLVMDQMSEKELMSRHCGYLLNVLNEVLNGFRVDFEIALKSRRENVSSLYEKLDRRCSARVDEGEPERLSSDEARLLLNCSLLCSGEFDESEFETRLGEPLTDAQRINQALGLLTKPL
jgi:hypothetical protein